MKKKQSPKNGTPEFAVNLATSLEEQVAQRAHELWLQRGGEHGSDVADWLQAEREIGEWRQQHAPSDSKRSLVNS